MLLTQEGTIKELREENNNLQKAVSREKSLISEKENLQRLLALKDDEIKSLR